ncbi:MAG: ATP-dependent helicase, partial [Bacillota bacterium]|nr:ATP-dependent helicase [Bacillota bacterium]
RKFVLGTNFRSTRQILSVAKGVIERNRKRVVKQMSFGFAAEGEPAIIHEARNEPDEAQWVATRIEEWADRQAEQGTDELARPKYRCQAVLARSGRLLDAVGEALKQRGIPYRLMTNRGYLEDRAVKAILAACRCAVSPARPFALMMTLRCFFPGLTRSRLRSVAETAAAAPDWADTDRTASGVEGAGAKGSAPPSLLEGVPAEVGNVLAVIKQVMDYPAGPDCATKAVDALLPLVRVHPEADEPHEHDPSALDDLLLAALEYDQRAGQSGSVIDFLGSLALQSNDPDIHPDGDEVRLMTLHSAKGLEFEAVYLIGVREWIVPLLLPGGPLDPRTDDDQLEEERRLFYVGMTRASRKLVVTWPEMNVTRAGGVARSVRSRFLAELGEPVRWV